MATYVNTVAAIKWSSLSLTRFTSGSQFDGLSSITQTKDGKIWLIWVHDILGNYTLFYKTSSNLGFTWSDEFNLTQELGWGQNTSPSIMQAQNGTIWVAWASDRTLPPPPLKPDFSMTASPSNLTIPKGQSYNSTIKVTSMRNFSDPVTLSVKTAPPDVTTTLNPNIVTPPKNGTVNSTLTVTVGPDAPIGNYTVNVLGRSGTLSHSVAIALQITNSGTSSGKGISSSSNLTQEEWNDYEIFYKTSNDSGTTWSKDIQLTNNTDQDRDPSIIQLQNGTILVAWQAEIGTSNPDIFYRTTSDGISWSNPTRLTTDTSMDKCPTLMQVKNGTIWCAWASNRSGEFEIFYKTYNPNSSTWTVDTRLTYSALSDATPSLLQTIDGKIWIFWSAMDMSPTGTSDVYYKNSIDGVTWSSSVVFTSSSYDDLWPSVTQTHDTKIWVTWTSNRADQPGGNWDIYFKTSLAGDVDQNGIVDILDISRISLSYGFSMGEPQYDSAADLNVDGIVDGRDAAIACLYYGQT
jgi:hypothetical protein